MASRHAHDDHDDATARAHAMQAVRAERTEARRLANDLGLPFRVPMGTLAVLEPATCQALQVAPIARAGPLLVVATWSPTDDEDAIATVEALTGERVMRVVVARCDFDRIVIDEAPPDDPAAIEPDDDPGVDDPPRPDRYATHAGTVIPLYGDQQLDPETGTVIEPAAADAGQPQPAAALEPDQRQLGQILLDMGAIDLITLQHALQLQQRAGGRLGGVLMYFGLATPGDVADAIAQQSGLPRIGVDGLVQQHDVVELVPESVCTRHRMIPLRISEHRLHVAMVDPGDRGSYEALARFTRLPIEASVTTEPEIIEALRDLHRDAQTEISVYGLVNRRPDESAIVVLNGPQKVIFTALPLILASIVFWKPLESVILLMAISAGFYLLFAGFKIRAIIASLGHEPGLWISPEEAAAIPERDLPIYTILVPLYMETEVLPRLVKGLASLDYPTSKMDVKLLLEEDDADTVAAARAMNLPAFIDVVVTPDSHPKTKPKSCNYGLLYARGEYTVIFDAEDIPEKDQLRKAVAAFRKSGERVVCLQGMLNYYNRNQNLLTKWFTGEYSGWFDLLVPGLDRLNLPIPLGGTSNHFVTDVLVELGAWDPFNVTEDADLGIRLFHAGYKTATLNSTTFEEANSETFNWIRQRSRWVKGYIQTWLVHMRHPITMARGVGVRNFFGFQLIIAGTFFVFLLNPVFWLVLVLWTLTQAHLIRDILPGSLFYISATSFLAGNFVFMYINALAAVRRRYWDMLGAMLLSPLYWMLMSIAAWRGLLQLIWAPSYWEKTEHGLDDGAHDDATADDVATIQAGGSMAA